MIDLDHDEEKHRNDLRRRSFDESKYGKKVAAATSSLLEVLGNELQAEANSEGHPELINSQYAIDIVSNFVWVATGLITKVMSAGNLELSLKQFTPEEAASVIAETFSRTELTRLNDCIRDVILPRMESEMDSD